MKKHSLCSLLILSTVFFIGCVGTPTVPFKEVLTTAPLFRSFDNTTLEEQAAPIGTGSLSENAQRELSNLAKATNAEKRVLLEIEKGDAFFKKGDMDTAIACFGHAIRLAPELSLIHI